MNKYTITNKRRVIKNKANIVTVYNTLPIHYQIFAGNSGVKQSVCDLQTVNPKDALRITRSLKLMIICIEPTPSRDVNLNHAVIQCRLCQKGVTSQQIRGLLAATVTSNSYIANFPRDPQRRYVYCSWLSNVLYETLDFLCFYQPVDLNR